MKSAPPTRSAGHQVALGLRAAYWALHRRSDASFGELGVTADQFVLLSALMQEDAITQQELVRRTSSDANTVRAMLLLLENKKLLIRRPHPTDRRARRVFLTAKGRSTWRRLFERSESVRQQLLSRFTAEETATLIDLLCRIPAVLNSEPVPTIAESGPHSRPSPASGVPS